MSRPCLYLALPASLALLLSACEQAPPPVQALRPALVVQPQAAAAVSDSYPGEVHARHEPQLAFRVAGKVSKRLVEEGDRVKAQQPLAELDPQDLRLELEANRAQLTAAQANLNLVKAERDRYATLLERGMVSRSLFDSADNQYRAGEARLRQIKAQLEVADNQAGYAVLRAPQAGVIARRMVETGQVVAAGQTVLALAADGEREVAISLPEHSFAQLRIGQPVAVELWSQPEQRFAGQIRELSPSADPRSRTFAARVAFSRDDVPAQIGQSARVFIAPAQAAPLSVPLAAVSAENGVSYVWRLQPGDRVRRTPVRVGAYGDDSVPVLEGLKAGDWVVAAGVHVLRDGQQVRPVDRSNRPVSLAGEE